MRSGIGKRGVRRGDQIEEEPEEGEEEGGSGPCGGSGLCVGVGFKAEDGLGSGLDDGEPKVE